MSGTPMSVFGTVTPESRAFQLEEARLGLLEQIGRPVPAKSETKGKTGPLRCQIQPQLQHLSSTASSSLLLFLDP